MGNDMSRKAHSQSAALAAVAIAFGWILTLNSVAQEDREPRNRGDRRFIVTQVTNEKSTIIADFDHQEDAEKYAKVRNEKEPLSSGIVYFSGRRQVDQPATAIELPMGGKSDPPSVSKKDVPFAVGKTDPAKATKKEVPFVKLPSVDPGPYRKLAPYNDPAMKVKFAGTKWQNEKTGEYLELFGNGLGLIRRQKDSDIVPTDITWKQVGGQITIQWKSGSKIVGNLKEGRLVFKDGEIAFQQDR